MSTSIQVITNRICRYLRYLANFLAQGFKICQMSGQNIAWLLLCYLIVYPVINLYCKITFISDWVMWESMRMERKRSGNSSNDEEQATFGRRCFKRKALESCKWLGASVNKVVVVRGSAKDGDPVHLRYWVKYNSMQVLYDGKGYLHKEEE